MAAIVHLAAATHFTTTLSSQNQPDVLSLHLDFLRTCTHDPFTINITDLKIGKGSSTIQLHVGQNGELKVLALATSTNFDHVLGPTVKTDWSLVPAPKPQPDFDKIHAYKPDENWLPGRMTGEIIPFLKRMLVLSPRDGFPVAGVCDAWNSFFAPERIDATYLALLTDIIPAMPDTLLRNGGIFDAHRMFALLEKGAKENPGIPPEVTNSLAHAMKAELWDFTLVLDIEFKTRLPEDGLQWTFTRASTKVLNGGRMDLDVTICDDKMNVVCLARQLILALDARRKFSKKSRHGPSL